MWEDERKGFVPAIVTNHRAVRLVEASSSRRRSEGLAQLLAGTPNHDLICSRS